MLRIAANYTAKIVCSNVFLAARDPLEVLHTDVQVPGHPLLRLMRVSVERGQGVVRAGLCGFIGNGLAPMRPGSGCAVGAGMRAIVVVHHGRLAAERYGSGFDRRTPLLGWSMTKSVMAGLIGILAAKASVQYDRHLIELPRARERE